jgi:hypothetical protein
MLCSVCDSFPVTGSYNNSVTDSRPFDKLQAGDVVMNSFRTNVDSASECSHHADVRHSFDVSYILLFVFTVCNSQDVDLC